MSQHQTKLDQALSLLIRQRLRTLSLENTVRDLAMLLSERTMIMDERNDIAVRPLGYVHGFLERLRDQIGSEVALSLDATPDGFSCSIATPAGSQRFTFSTDDYEQPVDILAASLRKICEGRGLLKKATRAN